MKSKTVIAIINGKKPHQTGGYQTYTKTLKELLIRNGYEARLLYLEGRPEISKLLILAPQLALSIIKNLHSEDCIVLFGIGPWTFAAVLAKLFLRNKKIKVICYYPTTFKHEFRGAVEATRLEDYGILLWLETRIANITIIPLYTLFERFFLWQSDKIVVHYASAKKILIGQFGLNPKKITVMPQYFDVEKLATVGRELRTKNLILSLSRQDARKGINFLLHALKILNDRGIKYEAVIAGEGRLLEANKRLAKKLGLENVQFPGFIRKRTELLDLASLFVLPSLEEGSSSISLLEAMSYGLPIVATTVDGIPEDVEHEISGLLVPPKNSKAMADAIQKLIENQNLAKKLGHEARQQFRRKNNSRTTTKEFNRLFSG